VDPLARAAVTAAELRATMAHLAGGVVLVTSTLDGEDVGMTATAFCSVSLDPPLVLVSVGEGSRMYDALATCESWAVSILPAGARQVATRFAIKGRPSDRLLLADLAWHRGPVTGHVVLDEGIASVECLTEQRTLAGDHAVVIGRVVGVHSRNPTARPLVHFRSRYRTLASSSTGPPDPADDEG